MNGDVAVLKSFLRLHFRFRPTAKLTEISMIWTSQVREEFIKSIDKRTYHKLGKCQRNFFTHRLVNKKSQTDVSSAMGVVS